VVSDSQLVMLAEFIADIVADVCFVSATKNVSERLDGPTLNSASGVVVHFISLVVQHAMATMAYNACTILR